MTKKTAIIGASPNPARYAYLAAEKLTRNKIEIVPIGIKSGLLFGETILNIKERPSIVGIDTITLYIGPSHQIAYYEYLISLKPRRIIFNPGTENQELVNTAESNGIETIYGCTLVMLSAGTY